MKKRPLFTTKKLEILRKRNMKIPSLNNNNETLDHGRKFKRDIKSMLFDRF